jgi:hypothetical protein
MQGGIERSEGDTKKSKTVTIRFFPVDIEQMTGSSGRISSTEYSNVVTNPISKMLYRGQA